MPCVGRSVSPSLRNMLGIGDWVGNVGTYERGENLPISGIADVQQTVGVVPSWVEHVELGDGGDARAAAELRPPGLDGVLCCEADELGGRVSGEAGCDTGADAVILRHDEEASGGLDEGVR